MDASFVAALTTRASARMEHRAWNAPGVCIEVFLLNKEKLATLVLLR
jgi:hypothetical protein